jgi:predicted ferric reductase
MCVKLLSQLDEHVIDMGGVLVGYTGPLLLASCLGALLLTTHKLPSWRMSWFQKIISSIRRHSIESADYGHDIAIQKKNQFGRGEANFDALAIWLVTIPMLVSIFAYLPLVVQSAEEYAVEEGLNVQQVQVEWVSYTFGWGSVLCLGFFMIPVTRHSILLAAMGWSPILALRIHVWSGYLSFILMMIHGIMLVPVWFVYYDYPVWQQIIPNPECWVWKERNVNIVPSCSHALYNLTGIFAAVFFIILWGSSLHWFRRRNYRLFYLLHVSFGSLTLLGIILHVSYILVYMIPSIIYYLASTMPTLIQALASRFRGGVKIRKVILVPNSGGCVELHLEAHDTTLCKLENDPCSYVKVCVPKISLVWHPFDVYRGCDNTIRFLFRPVGPFTTQFSQYLLESHTRPVTLVDGLYCGANKCQEALQHDCVTIVAGGVAITPFLTFLPALFKELRNIKTNKLKVIVLHWSCREAGLCTFVIQNYINPILKRAKGLETLKVAVYVYQTGDKNIARDSDLKHVETSNTALDPKSDEDMEACDRVVEQSGGSQTTNAGEVVDKEGPESECTLENSTDGQGHPFELARMMPRRYSSLFWNIPFFVAVSTAIWFGFWYLFTSQGSHHVMSYYDQCRMTWITVYCALMYVGFGIVVELSVLMMGKFWPKPKIDSFDVMYSPAEPLKQEQSIDHQEIDTDEYIIDNVTMSFRSGRPTEFEIFELARQAEEPGIFMCGPSSLTRMVKKEASKENSLLGLTRYCLYDEPYEL